MTIEVLFTSRWSGEALDYDELFRKDGMVTFSFQNDTNDSIDGPVLALEIGGGGLNMPLDGQEGRPTLAEITDGKPHHAVATADGKSGDLAIYLDGVKRFSHTDKRGIWLGGGVASTPLIGNYSGDLTEPFTGVIDEVAVYRQALSAEDIANHWRCASGGDGYFMPSQSPGDGKRVSE